MKRIPTWMSNILSTGTPRRGPPVPTVYGDTETRNHLHPLSTSTSRRGTMYTSTLYGCTETRNHPHIHYLRGHRREEPCTPTLCGDTETKNHLHPLSTGTPRRGTTSKHTNEFHWCYGRTIRDVVVTFYPSPTYLGRS